MSTDATRPDIPAAAAEAALRRVAELAETWDVAAEVDAHCARFLLDVIHGGGSADVRLSRVIALAEPWLAPGGPGLFYPAAGQAVLDAIRGASTEEAAGWRERAEAAEARLAAQCEYDTYRRALWVMVRQFGGSVFLTSAQMEDVPLLASLGVGREPGGIRINAGEGP